MSGAHLIIVIIAAVLLVGWLGLVRHEGRKTTSSD